MTTLLDVPIEQRARLAHLLAEAVWTLGDAVVCAEPTSAERQAGYLTAIDNIVTVVNELTEQRA
jgi:hypothetical protein